MLCATDIENKIAKNFNVDIIQSGLPVFIFGTKSMAGDVFDCFVKSKINIAGFIDNNRTSTNTLFGKKIFSLKEIEPQKDRCVIIIATVTYVYEIKKQLENCGFKNIIPAYVLEFCRGLSEFKQNPSIENLVKDYCNNTAEYEKTATLLCDDLSKQTFDTIVEFRTGFDIEVYQKIKQPLNKQYFEDFIPDAFKFDCPFADCGGYTGDTALGFAKFTQNRYKKIYFIEADPKTFETGKKETINLDNIYYYNTAVTDFKKQVHFSADFNTGSKVTDEGLIVVDGTDIDSLVKEDRAFIKMDIEGAEKEALLGAKRLIQNGSALAVSIYHRAQDLRELPQIIKNINPNYDFYLRHYTDTIFESVLYAIPQTNSITATNVRRISS